MSRLFEQYNKRNTVCLNGFWQFCTDEESKGEKEKWFLNFPEKGEKCIFLLALIIPSDFWNTKVFLMNTESLKQHILL